MYTQSKEFKTRIIHKHDVQSNWLQAENKFVPLAGELIVYDADGTYTQPRYKIGNGTDLLGNLPFIDAASVIEELDYTDAPETGKYVSAVTQSNGVIAVTKASLPTIGNAKITIAPGTKLTTGGDFTTNQGTAETITLNHETTTRSNTTSSAAVNHGDTFNVIDTISSDTTGHITAVNTKTVTLPKASLYYVEGSGSTVDSTAKTASWKGTSAEITSYYPGLTVAYKLDNVGSDTTSLEINSLGAVTVVRNATTAVKTSYPVGAVAFLTYTVDSNGATYWKAGDYDSNTTYTNVKLGHGYATCSTDAATVAKDATLSSYTLTTGGIVNVRFANGNTASKPTLNINSKGAKSIYYNNAALTDTTLIKAGDVVTFIYSTYYRIIAINGKYFNAQTTYGPPGNATPDYGEAFIVPSYTVTGDGRVVAGANRTVTLPAAQDLSNYKTKQTAVSNPTASGNATAFIDSISQGTNGEITVTKKNVQFPDYSNTYKKIQTAVSSPTASGNTTAFIDTISQDAQGKITVTKKNVQFPDYSNTYQPKGNYKTVQTAVSDPTASGSATAFIDSISQDANGEITVTKKNITAAALGLDRAMSFLGTTTTALTDGATTNPIKIGGVSTTAAKGDVVIVSGTDQEFIWTGSAWEEFGNASNHSIKGHTHTVTHQPAGSNSEVAITPAGSVSQPTFTGTAASHKHTFTGTEATISVTHKPAGSVTISTAAPTSGQTATYTPAGTVSKPTFTGTQATISSSFTPAGTVSKPTFTGSAATSQANSGTNQTVSLNTHKHSITAAGTVSQPTFTGSAVNTGASETLVESITTSIANRCFTFTISTGTHTHSVTAAGTVSKPTFTGSAVTSDAPASTYGTSVAPGGHTHSVTATGSVSQPTFTGTAGTATATYTPAGSVSQPTFTGTGRMITGSFSGTSATVSTKYTPAGTISDTSITPAGTVSKPTFTGTEFKHTHTFTGTSATLTTSGSNS